MRSHSPSTSATASDNPPQPSWRDRINPDWPLPEIQNVVATVDLGCRLDLKFLSTQAWNTEYNQKRFHALIMRIRNPRTTAPVFSSGKMVITGAKSEDLARLAARRHARAIQKCGFQTKFLNFKVQNFVGSVSCGFYVRLKGIANTCWQSAKHEPELFPGLVYTMVSPRVKCLVFSTGKVVITGAKSEEDVYEAFWNQYPIVLDFKVRDVPTAVAGKK